MLIQERKQVLIIVVAVAIVTAFVMARHLPLRNKMNTIRSVQAQQAARIEKGQADAQKVAQAKDDLARMRSATSNFEQQVPDKRRLGVFLHRIADLMRENGVKDQFIEPGEEIKTEFVNCIPLNMRCKGKLTELFQFFKSLQNLDRLVRIEEVRLLNDRDFAGEISMQTKAVIYYRQKDGQR